MNPRLLLAFMFRSGVQAMLALPSHAQPAAPAQTQAQTSQSTSQSNTGQSNTGQPAASPAVASPAVASPAVASPAVASPAVASPARANPDDDDQPAIVPTPTGENAPADIEKPPSVPMPHVPWAAVNHPFSKLPGAEITADSPDRGKTVTITIHGGIAPGDARKFAGMLRDTQRIYPGARPTIVLDSPGGVIGDALQIARNVATGGNPVTVPEKGVCASACFLIFAAANSKFVAHGAHVGVHSATDAATGAETVNTKAGTLEMARLCSQLHVPPSIIGRMVVTPGRGISWLSEDDLQSMGTKFLPAKKAG